MENYSLEVESDIEPQEVISLTKFIILSILSFGLYEIWWMYKAWRFFQQKDKLDIMPVARTLFCIIFLNSLFKKILNFARASNYTGTYHSELLVGGFIIANVLARLPDPFWLIATSSIVFLIQPFQALNFAKLNTADLPATERHSFSKWHIVIIVLGSLTWLLVLLGLLAGVE